MTTVQQEHRGQRPLFEPRRVVRFVQNQLEIFSWGGGWGELEVKVIILKMLQILRFCPPILQPWLRQ